MQEQEFKFTYSAKEQDEIKHIRKKYLPEEEDKMERLRRLDRSVTDKGSVAALVVGIIGALVMGFGMSLVMSDLATIMGWANALIPGVIIGVVGLCMVIAAYPLYRWVVARERRRVTPEILRLTEELMK